LFLVFLTHLSGKNTFHFIEMYYSSTAYFIEHNTVFHRCSQNDP